MKVVIVPVDGYVSVNGRDFPGLNLDGLPPDVHAVVWDGTKGEVQVTDPATGQVIRNDTIESLAPFQSALDAWELRRAEADAPPPPPPALTQFELDQIRYQRRATVQAELMSWMAADNMSRVRSGAWTVQQLTALMDDPSVTAAQAYMATLSYELAAQAIAAAATPLLTPEIKAAWGAKLAEHFYLEP